MADQSLQEAINDELPVTPKVNDLEELGSHLKGYAPLPKQGQTWATFEAEELSKHDISVEQFRNTEYYKFNVEKFVILFENEKMIPVEEPVVPERVARKIVINQPKDPMETGPDFGVILEGFSRPTPLVKTTFPSAVRIERTKRGLQYYYSLDKVLQFSPDEDPRGAILSEMDHVHRIIKYYDGMYVGIKNVPDSITSIYKTEDSGNTLKMGALFSDLQAPIGQRYLVEWRQFSVNKEPAEAGIWMRGVSYYGLRAEHTIIRKMVASIERDLFPYEAFYDFHALWDSHKFILEQMTTTVKSDKTRFYFPVSFEPYQVALQASSHFPIWIYQILDRYVSQNTNVRVSPDPETTSRLMKVFTASSNRANMATGIQNRVMAVDGSKYLPDIISILQMSQYVQADIELSMTEMDPNVIIGLLLIRLITPRRLWSSRALARMDNYLCRHFLTMLPFYRGTVDPASFLSQTSQLEELLTNGNNWARVDMAAFSGFLLNYSDSDDPGVFPLQSVNGDPVPTTIKNQFHERRLFPRNELGLALTEHAEVIYDPSTQYEQSRRFIAFMAVMTRHAGERSRWQTEFTELASPIRRVLEDVRSRIMTVRRLMFEMGSVTRTLSTHTLCAYGEPDHEREVVKMFSPIGFFNLVTRVSTIEAQTSDENMYLKSLAVHETLTQFGSALHFAKLFMGRRREGRKLFPSSEIIREALKMTDESAVKRFMSKHFVERDVERIVMTMPASGNLLIKIGAAVAFRKSIPPALFGYSPSVIYSNLRQDQCLDVGPRPGFQNTTLCARGAFPVVTRKQIEDWRSRDELFARLYEFKSPVEIRIPVGISLKIADESVNPINAMSVGYMAREVITFSDVVIGVKFEDDESRTDLFKTMALHAPQYYVRELPITLVQDFRLFLQKGTFLHDLVVWRELDFHVQVRRQGIVSRE
jgi:hypothetical protein